MATKKQKALLAENEKSQTNSEIATDEMTQSQNSEEQIVDSTLSQTELEVGKSEPDSASADAVQTAETGEQAIIGQTETKQVKKPRRISKTDENQTQSDTGAGVQTAGLQRRRTVRKTGTVMSIDAHRTVETEADKAKNDMLDLLESLKTGRILTGTVQGIERVPGNQSMAVIYHGAIKVVVPAEDAVDPPADFRDQSQADVFHYLLTKRLGAEVDYIVKSINHNTGIVTASRLEAMRAKRKQYYFGFDKWGNNLLYSGVCAESRVISVIRTGIFIDMFGLEIFIPLKELSYQRMMDATGVFRPGQRILVKVLEVDRSDRNKIKAVASVKQAAENPYEKALRRYTVGNCYVGTVSMVDKNGVFVALDGGIDCLCSYPKRGRPPRSARVTVRILGINNENNRIWGAITHISTLG